MTSTPTPAPAGATTEQPVVRLQGIAKRFGSAVALESVDLRFHPGTVTALTGENGSGKSTIAKVLGGVLQPDAGTIEVDGVPVVLPTSKAALAHGIALISQELTLAGDLSVAENVFLGRLPTRAGGVSWRSLRRAAAELFARYDMDLDPRAQVSTLPIEAQQQVEIARALAADPRVLILDEATSSLSEKMASRLLSLVEERRAAGTAVVMITHRMNEIYHAADAAAVLRDGCIIDTVPVPATPEEHLVRLMVGRELGDYYGTRTTPYAEEVVLRAQALAAPAVGLAPVDLEVRRGEILGVAGLSGSGKEALGHALAGAVAAHGEVQVDGSSVRLGDPGVALRRGIGFVPEDRKAKGLLLNRSVAENFTLAWGRRIYRRGVRHAGAERRRVDSAIDRYGVLTASSRLAVRQLSGGNQQKITIGRLFDLDLPVYVMSEPTRGIDVGSKSAIYAMLREQAARGAAVVFISSELNELCGVCDRVVTMYAGAVVDELVDDEITEEAVTHAMVTGRRLPAPAEAVPAAS